MAFGLKTTGAKELVSMLRGLPRWLRKRVLKKALRAGAQIIAKAAKSGAKKSLRKTVKVKPPKRLRGKEWAAMLVKASDPRAHLLELGTADRNKKSGASTGKMKPQPFMEPAFEASKTAVIDKVGEVVADELFKAAIKGASK